MSVFEAIQNRRSIRRYTSQHVEKEKIIKIIEAARLAPSAANRQPWQFVVVTNPEVRETLKKSYPREWFVGAPVVIVACGKPSEGWVRSDGEEYWKVDVSIAFEHIVLTAFEEGLGTCWIAAFDEEKARQTLGIPENVRILAMTPLGYPAEKKDEVIERKGINEILSWEKW